MIEKQVDHILREYPASRDDDRLLLMAYMHYFGDLTDEEREAFKVLSPALKMMPSIESLTRLRRKLQESNVYLRGVNYKPRKDREKQVREFYRTK